MYVFRAEYLSLLWKYTFKERFGKRAIKVYGNVTFTKPFLMLGKVTSDEHVNVLERY